MTHLLRISVVLAAFLVTAIAAPQAHGAGTVKAELNNNGNTLTITGDDDDNKINVEQVATDLEITELSGSSTTVLGSPVPLAGITKIIIKLKRGADFVSVEPLTSPDTDVTIQMGRGEDSVEFDDVDLRSLSVNMGRGTDTVGGGDAIVARKSKLDGSRGPDILDLVKTIVGPMDVKGFEQIDAQ